MENSNIVKRKREKKIIPNPTEVHWTSFEVRSLSTGKQLEIAKDLHDYVRLPDKYTVKGFVAENNVSWPIWLGWLEKYPVIKRAYEEAKMYMGTKRFDAGASRKGVESLMRWAGQFDPDALAYIETMKKMDAKPEQNGPTNITINMQDFDNEPLYIPQEEPNA